MPQLKIALGDLRHNTVGRHSIMMPINIGFISSYALAQVGKDKLNIRLYDDPEQLLIDIQEWQPDILALSNYCWNNEVSRTAFEFAKRIRPDTICIGGGPDFPKDLEECHVYLKLRKDMDFYIYLDGEVAFARLIQKIYDREEIDKLKSEPQDSVMAIHPKTGKLVQGLLSERIMNMDEIPSPYLTGLMDQWFDGRYAPMIETARGCPFTCTFCVQGSRYYTKLAKFTTNRLRDELSYIAERMRDHPHILLSFCDSNFGMYERDEDLAHHIRYLQDHYGWPNAFDVTTGKANYDRILRIVKVLQNRMRVTTSVQSMNDETLKLIKRKNISMNMYGDVQEELKKRGQLSVSEMIIPMPGETKNTFLDGVKLLLNSGVGRVTPYTTMMLKGTELASPKSREQFQMKTKWRIIPRQFGEYCREKTFEIEEVCIATNTMSFDDYLDCRGLALVMNIYLSEQYDIIRRHLKELEITAYDYYKTLWERIKAGDTRLSGIYNRFIQETQDELWDSREALVEHFGKAENYEKLLSGEYGDNLIRKYAIFTYIEEAITSFDLAYDVLMIFVRDKSLEVHQSLEAVKKWVSSLRDIGAVSTDEIYPKLREKIDLPYDVQGWYLSKEKILVECQGEKSYQVYCDERQREILEESKQLYGDEIYFRLARIFTNWSPKDLWRNCEVVG